MSVDLVGWGFTPSPIGGVLIAGDKVLLEILLKTTRSGAIIGGIVMIAGVVLLPVTVMLLHRLSLTIVLAEIRILDKVLVVPLVTLHFVGLRRSQQARLRFYVLRVVVLTRWSSGSGMWMRGIVGTQRLNFLLILEMETLVLYI